MTTRLSPITRLWLTSIQTRLIIFSLLFVLLPLAAVSVLVFSQARHSLYGQMGAAVREIAETTGDEVQRFINERKGDIQVIASSPLLTSLETRPEQKVAFLHLIQNTYGIYKSIYVTDAGGRIIAATDQTGGDHSDETWFQQAMQQNIYVSDVTYLASVRGIVLTFAAPIINDKGERVGVVAMHIGIDDLLKVIKDRHVGQAGEVFLVNREGRIVAEPDIEDIFNDVSSLPPVQAAWRGEPGILTALDYETDEPMLYGYAPLAGQEWVALAKLPEAELNAPANALAWRAGVIAVIAAVVGSLIIVLVTQSIVRPLRKLTQAARQLSAGDYALDISAYGDNEIGQLATGFKEMIVAVQQRDVALTKRAAELEHEIAEREHLQAEREQLLAEQTTLQQGIIEAQQHAIQELSTPIIPVMEQIIVMPLIGSIDSMRARDITRTLLAGIREHRAKVVILDVTGVPLVDSGVASHLNKTIQAARLKGARTIITGISDAVAETIVDLGIDWSNVETLADLQTGLVVALASLGIKLTRL